MKSMDLPRFLEARSGVACDAEYLRTLVRLSDAELATQSALCETRAGELAREAESLAASNMAPFVQAEQTLSRARDLCSELRAAAGDAVELSLAVLRPAEHPYAAIRQLLQTDALVYAHISQIEALLSLPEYVREVVGAGDFARALDVAHTAERLRTRYPHSVLIKQVCGDVDRSMDGLKATLLKSLRETTKLPVLTKAVGHLRQLAPENLLQKFVDARWAFIQAQWASIPSQTRETQPLAYLKQVIEVHREQVFAVISAVNTVFAADSGRPCVGQFARSAVAALLAALREHAPRVHDPAERASLWLQLAFCASSLGRVGADFWELLDADVLSREEWAEARRSQQEMASKAIRAARA